jgi:hypothetical protein
VRVLLVKKLDVGIVDGLSDKNLTALIKAGFNTETLLRRVNVKRLLDLKFPEVQAEAIAEKWKPGEAASIWLLLSKHPMHY